jgi:hypothetical protein
MNTRLDPNPVTELDRYINSTGEVTFVDEKRAGATGTSGGVNGPSKHLKKCDPEEAQ